ncbi:MAG: hypothetical protein NTW96_02525 [Planctomycetia bacterium]|nr:hypothetical protein [Planctomycetia bacterium]
MKKKYVLVVVCVVLVAIGMGAVCLVRWNHDSAFSEDDLLMADAADLKNTIVSAHLDVPLEPGKNVLWCGTFQLAHNETCSLVGEDLRFDTPSPVVDALNKKAFTKTDLDEASYVALAGFVRDGIHERIRRELDDKFDGQATPRLVPEESSAWRPQDIIAYSYLFKTLEFPRPFERLEEPLVFAGQELPAFGIEEYREAKHDLYRQIIILDYQSEEDFVVELKTKSEADRVILARVKPEETLAATVASVDRRAGAAGEPASPGDVLRVPNLNFDITRRYSELEGRKLVTNNPAVAKDLVIVSAVQNTRFAMGEQGVKLRSESHIEAKTSMVVGQRTMVFDKPFLLMLRRTDAKSPYFALWVDNPELLVK